MSSNSIFKVNGALATIDNSRKAVYGYDQRIEVFGSKGMVSIANTRPDTHVYLNAEGVHSALPHYFFLERYKEAYISELWAFLQYIREDRPSPVSDKDGMFAMVMGLAAKKSWHENRLVKLTEICE